MKRTAMTIASIAAVASGALLMRRARPRRFGCERLMGAVTIARDDYGIPIITAASRDDALFGLGYAIAQDRLWQMDMLRRTALGRLSEVAGPSALGSDRLMRLLGINHTVRRLVVGASDDARSAMEAFAAGVNLRIERGPLPLEFRVLRYRPEPWRPEDSFSILRLMGWSLSGFLHHDLVAELLRDTIGDDWTDAIFSGDLPQSPLVIGEPPRPPGPPSVSPELPEAFPMGGLSNAWAVAGHRSATGAPLLANDPHLRYTNPSIWCEASIDAPGFRVSGLTMPGLPGILVGRTPTLAWGLTAAMIPHSFLYRELLNDDETQAADGSGWAPVTTRVEEIGVRGQKPVRFPIRSTPRGPLLSDIEPNAGDWPVSIYWTGVEPGGEIEAVLRINAARSVDDILAARDFITAPALNMAVADAGGEIATISLGKFPVRDARAGLLDPTEHPPRYVPSRELPVERNPARGWIASANNVIVGPEYPYPLHGFYDPGYRIRRIGEVLDSRAKHSVADMRVLQLDQYSLHAAELTPVLLDLLGDDAPEWALRDLESWDYTTRPESRATLLFQAFYHHWVPASLGHRLPPDLTARLTGMLPAGFVPMDFCNQLLCGAHPEWMTESERKRIARSAFATTLCWIEGRLGSDHGRWTWGALHTVTFAHPFAHIKGPHRRIINVGPFPVGGDRTTVWPAAVDPDVPFRVVGGSSMRFIADLRLPGRAWATNTLGQSGRPLSRHARDQVGDFLNGRLHPIGDRPAKHRVTIMPDKG